MYWLHRYRYWGREKFITIASLLFKKQYRYSLLRCSWQENIFGSNRNNMKLTGTNPQHLHLQVYSAWLMVTSRCSIKSLVAIHLQHLQVQHKLCRQTHPETVQTAFQARLDTSRDCTACFWSDTPRGSTGYCRVDSTEWCTTDGYAAKAGAEQASPRIAQAADEQTCPGIDRLS
jgi:hypothetical protein